MSASHRRRRAARAWLPLAIALGVVASTPNVGAQTDAGQAPESEADRLFHEGRQLLKDGKFEDASSKLERSQQLDPSSGTLMNLAYCHQQLGKLASAFNEFSQAATLAATQQAPQREAEAHRRAESLAARLSYLVVRVTSSVPGLEVERNGIKLDPNAFGKPVPVDPGSQAIRATALGYTEWRLSLTITQPGELVVAVPELVSERATPQPRSDSEASAVAVSPRVAALPLDPGSPADVRHAADLSPSFWVAAGASALATGVGSVSGVMSLNSYSKAKSFCPAPHTGCSDDAITARSRAGTQAVIADIAFSTAVVAAGVGVYLFVTSRSTHPTASGARGLRLAGAPTPTFAWTW